MKRVMIVQARTGSTRLPGKVLVELAGRPMLVQQLRRVKRCNRIDELVVATTTCESDDRIVALVRAEGVGWFRGSENDVLGRYAAAARETKADLVVRVTADCPLIDPEESDRVVAEIENGREQYDYASNVIQRTFPRGLDTEALFADTLFRIDRLARSTAAREHVTHFILAERPSLFCLRSITDQEDNSDLRWTVDDEEDLRRVRRLYADLGLDSRVAGYREMLSYARTHVI